MVRRSKTPAIALLATAALLWLGSSADALKSDVAKKKLAVVESAAPSPQAALQQQRADALADTHGHLYEHDHDNDESETAVRCRFCGATVALKSDYIGLHDTSKAVASKRESILGDNGELHTFVNPSRVEMELAGFKTTLAVESELYTKKASFFEQYNWRDVRCSSCKRHLGWKFHHDDLQQCINAKTVESITAAAKAHASDDDDDDTGSERERRAEVVARAFKRSACVLANSGWWSYQVCYAKEVRQFHEEPDGTRPSDWSMGVFVPPKHTTDMPDMGSDVVQYFAGGQHCDENGEQRNTKVVYTCCKSKPASIVIDSVDEPSLCSYIINVCVPDLCDNAHGSDDDVADFESALEMRKHAKTCEQELTTAASQATPEGNDEASTEERGAGGNSVDVQMPPLSFTALRWATVISEDSSELDWARNMQFKA